ncbi:hypothetical protein [Metabacillus fastidiosus]|uniref:hypothetical protein n=1 Tax=Metabacillus fastidiosus TaxID=1458 RepID=UPI003D2746BE
MNQIEEITKVCKDWDDKKIGSRKAMAMITGILESSRFRQMIFTDIATSELLNEVDRGLLARIQEKIFQEQEKKRG